ncbi:MAG: hypothetical protein QHI48_11000 [Bacteroidota bacterium]|nr:hypothetical protein [Bacteroidota bacterium]
MIPLSGHGRSRPAIVPSNSGHFFFPHLPGVRYLAVLLLFLILDAGGFSTPRANAQVPAHGVAGDAGEFMIGVGEISSHVKGWPFGVDRFPMGGNTIGGNGTTPVKDSLLSVSIYPYAAATGTRGTTTKQFLLRILGVVLVIGLAALILYAAFPATNR